MSSLLPEAESNDITTEIDLSVIPESLPGIDVKSGLKRVNNNSSLYISLLTTFHDEYKNAVENIREAFNSNQISKVNEILHSIKGTSSNISAIILNEAVKELEASVKQSDSMDNALFNIFSDTMNLTLMAIAPLCEEKEEDGIAVIRQEIEQKNFSDEIKPMLEKLSGLLEENSFSSEKYLKKIITELGPEQFSKIKPLKQKVASLDFTSAKQELKDFAHHLGIILGNDE